MPTSSKATKPSAFSAPSNPISSLTSRTIVFYPTSYRPSFPPPKKKGFRKHPIVSIFVFVIMPCWARLRSRVRLLLLIIPLLRHHRSSVGRGQPGVINRSRSRVTYSHGSSPVMGSRRRACVRGHGIIWCLILGWLSRVSWVEMLLVRQGLEWICEG